MEQLMDLIFDIKGDIKSQKYIDINKSIMKIYEEKIIVVSESQQCRLTNKLISQIYNETCNDLEEWEIEDLGLEVDETLI